MNKYTTLEYYNKNKSAIENLGFHLKSGDYISKEGKDTFMTVAYDIFILNGGK